MYKAPWWSYERFHRVVYAISVFVIFIILFAMENKSGGVAYWIICFVPTSLAISLVGAVVVLGVYAAISYLFMRLLGMSSKRGSLSTALSGAAYFVLCLITFKYSKSIGQPDSQAIMAALFMTPLLATLLFVLYLIFMWIVGLVRSIKILQ